MLVVMYYMAVEIDEEEERKQGKYTVCSQCLCRCQVTNWILYSFFSKRSQTGRVGLDYLPLRRQPVPQR